MKYLTLKKSLDKVREQKGAGRSFNNYMVRQHCCTVPTQYVRRMCNESMQHSVVSTASSLFNYAASTVGTLASGIMGTPRLSLGTGGSILDGIVEIMHESNKDKQNRIRHTLQILDAGEKKPISDHVGLNLTIENDPLKFNIISYNLEGLCPNNSNHRERIENLRNQLTPVLTLNTIMVCQELVLKEQARDRSTKARHTEIIKRILGNVFEAKVDHTSAIFYNPTIWDVEMLEIKRNTGSGIEDKFSNAFKFVHKDLQYCFIVVNVHLLAPTPERQIEGIGASAMGAVGISSGLTTLEEKQDNELTNIIRKTITHFNNVDPKIPIYLCGDFNRHDANKDMWVRKLVEKLQKEQDEGEFEELDEELESDFEEVEAESFKNPYSATNKRPAQPPVILPVREPSIPIDEIPWIGSESVSGQPSRESSNGSVQDLDTFKYPQ